MKDDLQILWLSDIHWQICFSEVGDWQNDYINRFIEFLESKNIKDSINYVVISGDLVDGGMRKEYDSFERAFVKRLNRLFPEAVFLFVPGNHDLKSNRVVKFYEYYIENTINQNKRYDIKNTKWEKKIYNLFADFNKFAANNSPEFYDNKDKQYLYGIYPDSINETIFILVNSSWFSFTEVRYNEILLKNIKTKLDACEKKSVKSIYDQIKNLVEDALVKKTQYFTQYGKQSYGDNIVDELLKKVNDLKRSFYKPLLIFCAHHPPNWMDWGTMNTFEHNVQTIMSKIINQCDIILTGHEHSEFKKPDLLENKTLLFRAPMFLSPSNDTRSDKIPYNGFRILSINKQKSKIFESRYRCKREGENFSWEETNGSGSSYELRPFENNFYYKNFFESNRTVMKFCEILEQYDFISFYKYLDIEIFKYDGIKEVQNKWLNRGVFFFNNLKKELRCIIVNSTRLWANGTTSESIATDGVDLVRELLDDIIQNKLTEIADLSIFDFIFNDTEFNISKFKNDEELLNFELKRKREQGDKFLSFKYHLFKENDVNNKEIEKNHEIENGQNIHFNNDQFRLIQKINYTYNYIGLKTWSQFNRTKIK